MLITWSDDGYFGLRQSLAGVFDKAVSSWFDDVSEEHGFTEDGKTLEPRVCFPVLTHSVKTKRDGITRLFLLSIHDDSIGSSTS